MSMTLTLKHGITSIKNTLGDKQQLKKAIQSTLERYPFDLPLERLCDENGWPQRKIKVTDCCLNTKSSDIKVHLHVDFIEVIASCCGDIRDLSHKNVPLILHLDKTTGLLSVSIDEASDGIY
ncbi:hypothetical protein CI610_02558 [invertebrate metagenome]|uniref:Uncharacterized protein n=1 Tax=invertebrate metagenome TaxID=1711999 RepID=A0A2H9T5K3_9ZZZZ